MGLGSRIRYGGHAECAARLLAAGADPNARSGDGEGPLFFASRRGRAEVCHPLHSPSVALATELVRVLVRVLVEVLARCSGGWWWRVVRCLVVLKKARRIPRTSHPSSLPLMPPTSLVSPKRFFSQVVTLLLSHGANPAQTNR